MQLDRESNRIAVTIPRTPEAFDSHWAESLADPVIAARAIRVGEELVGYVSRFLVAGRHHVGYWIDRTFWGLGIASRALHSLLRDVTERPLYATVATSNGASLRVLQKCEFVVEPVRLSPATATPSARKPFLCCGKLPTRCKGNHFLWRTCSGGSTRCSFTVRLPSVQFFRHGDPRGAIGCGGAQARIA